MTKSFKCKETKKIFRREHSKYFSSLEKLALRKLLIIEAAGRPEDLKVPPGSRLERLSGNRAGQHSVPINDQWRICFTWEDGNALDVKIVDYH